MGIPSAESVLALKIFLEGEHTFLHQFAVAGLRVLVSLPEYLVAGMSPDPSGIGQRNMLQSVVHPDLLRDVRCKDIHISLTVTHLLLGQRCLGCPDQIVVEIARSLDQSVIQFLGHLREPQTACEDLRVAELDAPAVADEYGLVRIGVQLIDDVETVPDQLEVEPEVVRIYIDEYIP